MENKRHYLFEIEQHKNGNECLCVVNSQREIPFEIKRIFYEYGMEPESIRGAHANKKSRFCMIAVAGSCDVAVDDGNIKQTYRLDCPNIVLYLDQMVWKTMTNFSKDCVLLVVSDSYYDSEEYIKDYEDYCLISKD